MIGECHTSEPNGGFFIYIYTSVNEEHCGASVSKQHKAVPFGYKKAFMSFIRGDIKDGWIRYIRAIQQRLLSTVSSM